MKKLCLTLSTFALLLVAGSGVAFAQASQSTAASDSYGFRRRAVVDPQEVQNGVVPPWTAARQQRQAVRPPQSN